MRVGIETVRWDAHELQEIGGALTRAFLPDATLRQFAGAGLELVRGDRD